MKYFLHCLVFLFSVSSVGSESIEIKGDVSIQTIELIKSKFDDGAPIIESGHISKILPKNLGGAIYKIANDDGYFEVRFKEHRNQSGYDTVTAKFICDTLPCEVIFYNHIKTMY